MYLLIKGEKAKKKDKVKEDESSFFSPFTYSPLSPFLN
jgi:hypothetical protein